MGLARELGPNNITVNAIAPAIADTAMTHARSPKTPQKNIGAYPARPVAALSDIADLRCFLDPIAQALSPDAIPVDGGILTT